MKESYTKAERHETYKEMRGRFIDNPNYLCKILADIVGCTLNHIIDVEKLKRFPEFLALKPQGKWLELPWFDSLASFHEKDPKYSGYTQRLKALDKIIEETKPD